MVTQFAVPSPPFGMVERPRLSERLRNGLAGPVTLVCAPAGSGKTALVAAGAQRCARPVAWVTLESSDDEPGRLWEAVLTALHAGRRGTSRFGAGRARASGPRITRHVHAAAGQRAG